MATTILSLKEQFESKFIPEPNSGCWLWVAATDARGYGRLSLRTWGEHLAHRVSYRLYRGEFPAERHVLHRCDNPTCVNPDHLFLGTHADNMADMARKQRACSGARCGNMPSGDQHWTRLTPERRPRGEKQANAKLTESNVRAIRASTLPQRTIAKSYGICQGVVWRIRRRISWTHLA